MRGVQGDCDPLAIFFVFFVFVVLFVMRGCILWILLYILIGGFCRIVLSWVGIFWGLVFWGLVEYLCWLVSRGVGLG